MGGDMFSFLMEMKPKFGRVKLIEYDAYTLMLDCSGSAQPMSYCEAVRSLKSLDFEIEERGTGKDGKDFEIWKQPKENNRQKCETFESGREGFETSSKGA